MVDGERETVNDAWSGVVGMGVINLKWHELFLTTINLNWHELFLTAMHGGYESLPHYNFFVIAAMIMKFSTGTSLYTLVTKKFVMSILLGNYDVIACILTAKFPQTLPLI